jgi:hypothetical protein
LAHGKSIFNTAIAGSLLLGLWLAACGDDATPEEEKDSGDESPEAGSQTGSDAGTNTSPDAKAKVGTFTLRLVPPMPASGSSSASNGYTAISGKVFSGAVPEEVAWEVDSEQGGCKLLKPRVPFCEVSCGLDVCVDDDKCEPNPKAVDVGTVTVSGLKTASGGSSELKIEPIAASYSTPAGANLAYPPFEEGAEIKLSAAGGAASAFDIASRGIAPLELTTTSFALKSDSAFALTWKAAGKNDISRIQIKLDISHHGGTKGKIECDVPDTGSLSIAADLVSKLLKLGVAGFPTVVVDRVSSGTKATAGGTVELRVVSEIEQGVEIDGLTSCDDTSDCPAGKVCQANLSCSK